MTTDRPGGAFANTPCPLCGTVGGRRLHRFRHHAIRRCRHCSLTFVAPPPDPDGLLRYADDAHRGGGLEETASYFAPRRPDDHNDPVVRRAEAILELLAAHGRGRLLLDVGCGNGDFLAVADRRGWRAVGIDGSPAAALGAGRRAGVRALAAAFPGAGLAAERFDAVVMLDFLEHVVDPRAAVAEARRLLRPGGLLYVNSPNHRSLLCLGLDLAGRLPAASLRRQVEKYYHPSHPVVFDPASLRFLLEGEGLVVVSAGRNNPILDRFELSPALRVALAGVAAASRLLGLEARLWALARKPAHATGGRAG